MSVVYHLCFMLSSKVRVSGPVCDIIEIAVEYLNMTNFVKRFGEVGR